MSVSDKHTEARTEYLDAMSNHMTDKTERAALYSELLATGIEKYEAKEQARNTVLLCAELPIVAWRELAATCIDWPAKDLDYLRRYLDHLACLCVPVNLEAREKARKEAKLLKKVQALRKAARAGIATL